jgi:hypothetical protein
MPAGSFPTRRLLPSVVPFRPGFLSCASPRAFRTLARRPSEHHSYFPPERPAPLVRAGFFCRCTLMSRSTYLPFPLLPLRGTVRASRARQAVRKGQQYIAEGYRWVSKQQARKGFDTSTNQPTGVIGMCAFGTRCWVADSGRVQAIGWTSVSVSSCASNWWIPKLKLQASENPGGLHKGWGTG